LWLLSCSRSPASTDHGLLLMSLARCLRNAAASSRSL
jgi:hypothetical protein